MKLLENVFNSVSLKDKGYKGMLSKPRQSPSPRRLILAVPKLRSLSRDPFPQAMPFCLANWSRVIIIIYRNETNLTSINYQTLDEYKIIILECKIRKEDKRVPEPTPI